MTSPLPAQQSDVRKDVVEMETFEVTARRYQWHYARVDDFEILSALDNDELAAGLIDEALSIIATFRARNPLFRIQRELPTKIILIKDPAVEKFISTVNSRMGAEIEQNAQKPNQKIQRSALQGLGSSSYYDPKKSISRMTRTGAEQAQIIMYIPAAYRAKGSEYYAVSKLVDAYFELCFASGNFRHNNLNYIFWRNKILSLDSSERSLIKGGERELLNKDVAWYVSARDRLQIRRFDYKRERTILQQLFPDYYKKNKNALSQSLFAPKIGLRDVLENPKTFRIDYDVHNTLEAVENCITYKREISDFSLYCVFAPDERVRTGYIKLLSAMRKQPLTETLFEKCFGMNYEDFQTAMYAHYRSLGKDDYTGAENTWGAAQFSVPMPAANLPSRPVFREANRAERTRIFAEWFLACNAPHLAQAFFSKAEEDYPLSLSNPEYLAARGLYEARSGDKTKALDLLEKAALLKTTRPAAYRALAQLRYYDIRSKKDAEARFTSDEIKRVIEPINTALADPRHDAKTYLTLIRAWRSMSLKPSQENLQPLVDACLANPDNMPLIQATVPLLKRNDMDTAADEILDAANNGVRSERESETLKKLRNGSLSRLPPAWDEKQEFND